MRRLFLLLAVLFSGLLPAGPASSHALEPGYVSIEPVEGDLFRVFWRRPDVRGNPMPLDLELPDRCTTRTPPPARSDGRAWVAMFSTECVGGMSGGRIVIGGLEATRTDVLLRYTEAEGATLTERLTPDRTSVVVPASPDQIGVFVSYFGLGFEHILEGWDHLLFVFALLLLIRDPWRLVGAITAFTVAHSITLAAATLGWITVPSKPVEAIIALSIVFLASELVRGDKDGLRLSQKFPWLITFSFGLLHGLGFAGALTEIGLPAGEVPLALLAFNLGVEGGQLAFIAATLVLGSLVRAIPRTGQILMQSGGQKIAAYAIGCAASFWLIERIVPV